MNITTAVSTSPMTLLTTPDSVEVNACCAPITSLLSRLTSAPVWVRVKNASDIRCTCSKTWVRMVKIRPSPIREENQRPDQTERGVDHGEAGDHDREPDHRRHGAAAGDLVDDATGQQRRGHPDDRRHDGEQQEDDDLAAERTGEAQHPAEGAGREGVVLQLSAWWAAPRIAHIA